MLLRSTLLKAVIAFVLTIPVTPSAAALGLEEHNELMERSWKCYWLGTYRGQYELDQKPVETLANLHLGIEQGRLFWEHFQRGDLFNKYGQEIVAQELVYVIADTEVVVDSLFPASLLLDPFEYSRDGGGPDVSEVPLDFVLGYVLFLLSDLVDQENLEQQYAALECDALPESDRTSHQH